VAVDTSILAIWPSLICGQTPIILTVHVTDPTGALVRDADVTATPTELEGPVAWTAPVTLKTSPRGEAQFSLSPGIYRISVLARGFQQLVVSNLEVGREYSQQLPLVLTLGATECEPCFTQVAPPPIELIEAPPLTALIELKPPIALLSLPARSATKGMFRKHPVNLQLRAEN
jgi:hypothetical protein